jgi:UDP-N-acetylmuramoyl-tripeptide--D-alanyl-D-alanine ligase
MFKINELLKATRGKLIRGNPKIPVSGISIDSRTIKPHQAFIAIKGYNFDGHDFIEGAVKKGASCIIAKKRGRRYSVQGIRNVTLIEVPDTIKALGDIARYQRRRFNIPVIAITGSNGKTTTKDMLTWVLSKKFNVLKNEGTKNNQIGLPLTLLACRHSHDIAVLEVGTNHFGEVNYLSKICQPNIGIVTNIGPAHLKHFHTLEGAFKEKYALIENLKTPRLGILNADDRFLKRQIKKNKIKPFILGFGIKSPGDFMADGIRISKHLEFLVNRKHKITLNTPGYYNIYNALAAIVVARIFGMEYNDIRMRLADFIFPKGRLKLITLDNIRFIDDTYNSNPLSLEQALGVLKDFRTQGRKIFIMGDMLELGAKKEIFHCRAGKDAAGVCDIIITVGELSRLSAQAAKASGFKAKNLFSCDSPVKAGEILFNVILPKKDDIVLVKGSRAMQMEEVFKKG